MSDAWQVTTLEELVGYSDTGRPSWHMIRSSLGIEAFGINAWTATEDGQQLIGEHDELGDGAGRHEELYLVLSGSATFTLDGDEVAAPEGTLVHVPDPAVRRSATGAKGTIVVVIGGARGEAFSVSPWERSAEALRYWTSGDWDKAIAALERLVEETPDDANVLYNLACAEARGGRTDAAIEHLRGAIALRPDFLGQAQDDPDFAGVRDDPAWPTP